MLDNYKEKQPIVYKMMKNTILNQKLSHAYLLNTKNCSYGNELALSFVKYLLCPLNKTNLENCGKCTQCQKIDDFNYTELKIIDPEGIWIKKEQMDKLQEEFSKKAINGKYKVYIIHQVERLNKAAANSLLKFLEEPEEGIIAILTTDNLFQVLETIRSRCQILSLSNYNESNKNLNTTMSRLLEYIHTNIFDSFGETQEKKFEFINNILLFIENLEKKGQEVLLYTTRLWHSKIHEKEELLFAFDIMTFFYSDVMNKKCDRPIRIFIDQQELINFISEKNTIKELAKKINIIMNLKQKIKINMNNSLLIDKLILSITGGD